MADKLSSSGLLPNINNIVREKNQPTIRTTKTRWIVLIIYIIYATLSTLQFIQYSIIANLVCKYYGVSPASVDLTALIFMLVWPVLVFPTSYLIDKTGLRVTGLIGAFLTAIGAFIKVFSVGRDLFYVVLIGQTVTAISQLFILSVPATIAVTWFKPQEVSTVCALGIFGMTFGTALGFLLPPLIIKDHESPEDIGDDMKIFNYCLAISAGIVALVVFFYFPREPRHPPSQSRYDERQNRQEVTFKLFVASIKDLFKNKAFLIHIMAYSCNFGVYTAFGAFLNQFVLEYFENAQEDAGKMGMCNILLGTVGSILIGFLLDKTHKFKEISLGVYILCSVTLAGFMFALENKNKWLVYAACSVFGIFINSYLPCGFEFAIEITYPSQECTVSGLLLACSQLFGFILSLGLGKVMEQYGTYIALWILVGILGFGSILTFLTPSQLKRQAMFNRQIVFEKVSTTDKGQH